MRICHNKKYDCYVVHNYTTREENVGLNLPVDKDILKTTRRRLSTSCRLQPVITSETVSVLRLTDTRYHNTLLWINDKLQATRCFHQHRKKGDLLKNGPNTAPVVGKGQLTPVCIDTVCCCKLCLSPPLSGSQGNHNYLVSLCISKKSPLLGNWRWLAAVRGVKTFPYLQHFFPATTLEDKIVSHTHV